MSESLEIGDERLQSLARLLGASVNARILAYMVDRRKREPDDGWRYLSQIAAAIDEKPGTVSVGLQRLLPLLEEDRRKGRRFFRSRLAALRLELDYHSEKKGARSGLAPVV